MPIGEALGGRGESCGGVGDEFRDEGCMLFAKKNFPWLGWWAIGGLDVGFVLRTSPARKNMGDGLVAPYCDWRESDLSDLVESRDPVALEGLWTSSAAEGGRDGMRNWDIFEETVSALGFLAADLGERVVTFGCREGLLEVLLMTRGRWATRGVGVVGGGRGYLFGAVLLEEDIVEGPPRRNLGSVVIVDEDMEEDGVLSAVPDADEEEEVDVEEVVVVVVVAVAVAMVDDDDDDAVTVMTGSFIIVMA